MDGAELGARLRERDLSAAPAALNLLESATDEARDSTGIDAVAALTAELAAGVRHTAAP